MAVEEAPHCAGCKRRTLINAQQFGQLNQADVLLRLDSAQDHVAERLDMVRTRVATLRLRLDATRRIDGFHPADGARRRHTEALSGSSA